MTERDWKLTLERNETYLVEAFIFSVSYKNNVVQKATNAKALPSRNALLQARSSKKYYRAYIAVQCI